MKIVCIVLFLITLIVLNTITKRFAMVMNSKNLMMRDIEMYKIQYSEEVIISHLNFIIEESLDYYIAIEITPKQIYYISNSLETEIVENLSEIVSSRISPTLYSQLSLIYDSNQIAKIIGEKIYTAVVAYVVDFNVQYEGKNKK